MVTGQITQDETRRVIQTEDFQIEYYEVGQGYPVIMLHGIGPGATGWSNFYPNLGALGEQFHAIAMTFPGWGQSSPFDPSTEPRGKVNARAVKQLMDTLGYEKAALVGNSMGGMCIQQFSLDYPERLSHFITMGSPFLGGPAAAPSTPTAPRIVSEGLQIIRETYLEPTPTNFRRLVEVMVYDSSFVTDDLIKARSSAAMANPIHLENWLKPAAGTFGGLDLSHVETPALIIHGRDDRTIPLDHSLRLSEALTNAELHVFNHCGHWAQIEHSATFNWLVANFVLQHL
jgi:2-hydroxy-6-oxonona-2,4-dienedioate hydrolase